LNTETKGKKGKMMKTKEEIQAELMASKKKLNGKIARNIVVALGAGTLAVMCYLMKCDFIESGDIEKAIDMANFGVLMGIMAGAPAGVAWAQIEQRAKISKELKEMQKQR